MMYAEHKDGSRWLVPIEWKYTEHYGNTNKATEGLKADPVGGKGAVRLGRYGDLIRRSEQLRDTDSAVYFFEPFYQLMRQTLLVEQMVRHSDQETLKADRFLHVHVIPASNNDLLRKSYKCSGAGMEETWRRQLQDQSKYRIVDPQHLLSALGSSGRYASLLERLHGRYWS